MKRHFCNSVKVGFRNFKENTEAKLSLLKKPADRDPVCKDFLKRFSALHGQGTCHLLPLVKKTKSKNLVSQGKLSRNGQNQKASLRREIPQTKVE